MKKITLHLSRINFICIFLLAFIFSLCYYQTISAEENVIYKADVKEVHIDTNFSNIQKIFFYKNCIYVLDSGNHRVVSIKDNIVIDQIGVIGNKKGEFYYPSSLFIDDNLFFYVIDRGNHRIQIIDPQGHYLGEFTDRPFTFGIAVDSKGLIFMAQPNYGKHVSVYNINGKRVFRFGDLINPSDIYGNTYKKYDSEYRIPMNRVYLAIGENDEIWAAFYHMPLICRYDNKGNLIYKKIINIRGVEKLKNAVWDKALQSDYLSLGMDGTTLTMVINDIVYEKKSKNIYVLMGDNQIFVINVKSNENYVIKPRIIKGAIEKIGITDKGVIYLSFFFSSKLYRLYINK